MSLRNFWKNGRRSPGRTTRIPRLESLESRSLLTAGFSIVPSGLTDYVNVPSIVTGSDGNLWYAAEYDGIGQITTDGVTTVYPITNADGSSASIGGLTLGKDGNIWFTDGNSIGSITSSGTVNIISIPDGHYGFAITTDNSGNVWFTDENGNAEEYQLSDGTFSVVALTDSSANFLGNQSIAVTPDGNVWVSVYSTTVTNLDGGDVWGVNGVVDKIATDGTVTSTTIGNNFDFRLALTVGPDGNVWFIDWASQTVGSILPDGSVTSYAVTGQGQSITTGSDGALWFTLTDTNGYAAVGRVDTSGNVSYFAPSADSRSDLSQIDAITTGPDGAIWFSKDGLTAIGRLDVTTTPGDDVPIVDTAATFVPVIDPPFIVGDPTVIPIDFTAVIPIFALAGPLEVSADPLQGTSDSPALAFDQASGSQTPAKAAPSIDTGAESAPTKVVMSGGDTGQQSAPAMADSSNNGGNFVASNSKTSDPVGPLPTVTSSTLGAVVQGPLSYRQARQDAVVALGEARFQARASYRGQLREASVDATPSRRARAVNQALLTISESRVEALGTLKSAYRRFRGTAHHQR